MAGVPLEQYVLSFPIIGVLQGHDVGENVGYVASGTPSIHRSAFSLSQLAPSHSFSDACGRSYGVD